MAVKKRKWTTAKGEVREGWQADYYDDKGNRQRKLFRTKKEADSFVAKARIEIEKGVHVADRASATVAQAGRVWIERGETEGLEHGTLRNYRTHLARHIEPAQDDQQPPAWRGRFGDLKLSKLNGPTIEAFRKSMLRVNTVSTARKVMTSLKSLLGEAARTGLIAYNPASTVKMRDAKRHKRKVMVGLDIPTKAEMRTILATKTAEDFERCWRVMFMTAAFTGPRMSELRALEWSDVHDLETDNPTLWVRQRVDKWNRVGDTKTSAAQRHVPLPPQVVTVLLDWREKTPDQRLLFPRADGTVQRQKQPWVRWQQLQVAAGVVDGEREAKYTFHALRHFYASLAIDTGMNPKRLQTLMGHSSITVTLDIYSHLFPSEADDRAKIGSAASGVLEAA